MYFLGVFFERRRRERSCFRRYEGAPGRCFGGGFVRKGNADEKKGKDAAPFKKQLRDIAEEKKCKKKQTELSSEPSAEGLATGVISLA